jgi:hypothetical protein
LKVLDSTHAVSYASANFRYSMSEAELLLSLRCRGVALAINKPEWDLQVLKRAAVILAVTTWETYIEDMLRERFNDLLGQATEPAALTGTFNHVAHAWLDEGPKPPDLAQWTGSGWRDVLRSRFEREVQALNTPNSANIRRLTQRYLGGDLTTSWKWPGVGFQQACRRLDAAIELRGRLAHRARDVFRDRGNVPSRQAVAVIALLRRLSKATDTHFNVCWLPIPGPGRI